MDTFDWVQFPEGQARFAGGIRGGDERGYETFAVEVNGIEYFGEIDKSFLPDRHNYNIEIRSFGYAWRENVGNPSPGARKEFTSGEIRIIRSLALQLVTAGLNFERRPFVLTEHQNSKFVGGVDFRGGWARESHEATSSLAPSPSAGGAS